MRFGRGNRLTWVRVSRTACTSGTWQVTHARIGCLEVGGADAVAVEAVPHDGHANLHGIAAAAQRGRRCTGA